MCTCALNIQIEACTGHVLPKDISCFSLVQLLQRGRKTMQGIAFLWQKSVKYGQKYISLRELMQMQTSQRITKMKR
jgi:hypothetical protein